MTEAKRQSDRTLTQKADKAEAELRTIFIQNQELRDVIEDFKTIEERLKK